MAIEVFIDVGQHIISSESLRGSDFADVFAVLGEAGVLSPEMVTKALYYEGNVLIAQPKLELD